MFYALTPFYKKACGKISFLIGLYLLLALFIAVTKLPFLFSIKTLSVPLSLLYVREFLFFAFLSFFVFSSTDKLYLTSLLGFLLTLSIQLFFTNHSFELIAFGFRSLLAFLFLFSIPASNGFKINSNQLDKVIVGLFSINLFLQFTHFFLGSGFYAKLFWLNLNSRNPGFFFFPAASAVFSLALFTLYAATKEKLKTRYVMLTLLSVCLCASLTGIAGAVLILFLNRKKVELKAILQSGFVLLLGVIYLHLARLSMTGNTYLQETGGGRVKIFEEIFRTASFFSLEKFGYYTNAAANLGIGHVADSQYSAIIGNLGFLWSAVLFIYICWLMTMNHKRKCNLDVVWLFLLCSFGLNTSETGPIIFLAILGRFVQKSDSSPLFIEFKSENT